MSPIVVLFGGLFALVVSPLLASKVMRLPGGMGKSALVGLVTTGITNIVAMIAGHLGPLGGVLGIMLAIAGWYQVVKIVYGTDPARTLVFMFWHLFFQLLILSMLSAIIEPGVFWVLGF